MEGLDLCFVVSIIQVEFIRQCNCNHAFSRRAHVDDKIGQDLHFSGIKKCIKESSSR